MQPNKHPYHLALKWVEQNEEIQGIQEDGTWRDLPYCGILSASNYYGNAMYYQPDQLRIKPKMQEPKEMQQLELDFSAPEQPDGQPLDTLYDYQKYNIAVGQIYARADDATQEPAMIVIDVNLWAERGDVLVKMIDNGVILPNSHYCIDCFKLSKVRYVLVG